MAMSTPEQRRKIREYQEAQEDRTIKNLLDKALQAEQREAKIAKERAAEEKDLNATYQKLAARGSI